MKGRYTRVHRLLKILTLLQSGGSWNADRLARECGTTVRNIFRDLNMLEGAGIPYFHDPESGGYRIRRDFFMPPTELTLEEALAVVCLANQAGNDEQIPFMKAAGRAAAKLQGQLPATIRDRLDELCPHVEMRLAAVMPPEGIADVYELIRQAIATRRTLACQYESARNTLGDTPSKHRKEATEESFVLKPYCLYFGQRAWYVIGHHSGRRAVRCLKLNRFTDVRRTDKPYAIPDGFTVKKHFGKAWRMIPGDQIHRIELQFDARFAENIADTHWHDTQDVEWLEDGSILFRCEVSGLEEIVWWILSMGPHCVVRKPGELADRVRDLARATAAQYLAAPGTKEGPRSNTRRRLRKPAISP